MINYRMSTIQGTTVYDYKYSQMSVLRLSNSLLYWLEKTNFEKLFVRMNKMALFDVNYGLHSIKLFYCFTSDHQTLQSIQGQKWWMAGGLILTYHYSELRFQNTGEIIIIITFIYLANCKSQIRKTRDLNSRPFGRESFVITTIPECFSKYGYFGIIYSSTMLSGCPLYHLID